MRPDIVKLGVTLAVAALMLTSMALVGQIMTDLGYSESAVKDGMMYALVGTAIVGMVVMLFTFSWINNKVRKPGA